MLPIAILAGGLATRLRPLFVDKPKSLIEIAGEPFLAHQLRLLRSQGLRSVVLCVGYLGEQIQEFAGDGRKFDLDIVYSWDGPKLRGTGGALKNALPLLGPEFFVIYGDSYLTCSFSEVERAFLASGKPGLMTVFRNLDQWDRSNVEFSSGMIRSYSKKTRTVGMQHIDYGLGVVRAHALNWVPDDAFCDLAELYGSMLREGQLAGVEIAERFYEVGSFAGIEELSKLLSSGRDRHIRGTDELHSTVSG
jgi:N-acetyl-alpha-D-muramate 1-phosphate uridylyltransferase